MITDVIAITKNRALSISAVCEKLTCSEKELVEAVAKAKGTNVRIVDGMVWTKQRIEAKAPLVLGNDRPGRKMVPIVTDIHFGSTYCMHRDVVRFLSKAWKIMDKSGIDPIDRVVVCTGDILDGNMPKLIPEQNKVGFDHQVQQAVDTFSKCPPFQFVAIDGNHDGYFSASIGFTSGEILEQRMEEAGVRWNHIGVCLGRAKIHGAQWQLWHGMGGAGTRNAVRRILNARAEAAHDHTDIIALGHFHKYTPLPTFPERIYGVAGGCFQAKGSEFANRITGDWDVGGTIVTYDITKERQVTHVASEFYAVPGQLQ